MVIRVAVGIVAAAAVVVVVNFYLFVCKLVCFSHANTCITPTLISSIAHVVS